MANKHIAHNNIKIVILTHFFKTFLLCSIFFIKSLPFRENQVIALFWYYYYNQIFFICKCNFKEKKILKKKKKKSYLILKICNYEKIN